MAHLELNPNHIIQGLFALLILILSGLFTWSLLQINSLNEKYSEAQTNNLLLQAELEDIGESLAALAADNKKDGEQDESIRKFWRITSTHRDWINGIRSEMDLPLQSWPSLD